MIDIASRATNGVRIPNRKATRKAIVELFKQNLTKLRNRVTVCAALLLALFIPFNEHCKPSLTRLVWLVWRVMHGRLATKTRTLQLRVTGMRRWHQVYGRRTQHCLVSPKWTLRMMVWGSVELYSILWGALELFIRRVTSILFLRFSNILIVLCIRLGGSPVITRQTTLQCSKHFRLVWTHPPSVKERKIGIGKSFIFGTPVNILAM